MRFLDLVAAQWRRGHKKLWRIVMRFLNLILEMIDHKKLSKIVKRSLLQKSLKIDHKKLWRIVKRFLNLTLEMIDHKIQ